jgi:hypothetical protein
MNEVIKSLNFTEFSNWQTTQPIAASFWDAFQGANNVNNFYGRSKGAYGGDVES